MELWTVISNQMIKYQLPHTWVRSNYRKHGICVYEKLPIKLLAQVANKNTIFMFMKTGQLLL